MTSFLLHVITGVDTTKLNKTKQKYSENISSSSNT